MNKKVEIIKQGLIVMLGSLVVLAAALLIYFLFITFVMNRANPDGTFNFVAPMRIGYSITWLVIGLFI